MGKRAWRWVSVFFLLAVLAVAAGCGRKGEEATGPQVSVERTGEGGILRLKGEDTESQVEVWKFDPGEESLDIPVYPGAELVPESALVSRTEQGEKVLLVHQAEYETAAEFKAVARWYRERMGEPLEDGDQEVTWVKGDGKASIRSVIVERAEGGTRIRIVRLDGDLGLRLEE